MVEKKLADFIKKSIQNEHLYNQDELTYMKGELKRLKKMIKKKESFLNYGEQNATN